MCLPFEEVIDAYKGAPNYAAHNAKFDAMFVGKELGGIQICTLKCAYAAWPEAPGYGNQVLRYWLDLPPPPHEFGHAHRALYDVWCTAHILLKLFEQGWTVDRMIDVSTQPRTLRVVPFGKHRGTAWADLDAGYLQWMSRTGGWDEDVAHTLKKELERRRG
jgi:exodeoxyribonuclease X